MISVKVTVDAEVRPTEDPEKVRTAITNLFAGEISFDGSNEDYGRIWLRGSGSESLETFKMILHRDRIRAAARSMLLRSISDSSITVYLNKQAAYAGHVSFSAPQGESPLGPIRLLAEASNPIEIINWLTAGEDVTPRK